VNRGPLIAFEGIDGSGKSTQIRLLADRLEAAGIAHVVTFEPTKRETGRRIREMARSGEAVAPEQELEWFMTDRAEHVRELAGQYPLFGICLGHQILALAMGGEIRKLKFGHHGGNQPGKDLATGKVAICAENHGYAVDADSLRQAGEPVEITHVNLNDQTVEGLAHRVRPLLSVQYHPEASPGPHDARYFFRRFREMFARRKAGEQVSGAQIAMGG